MVIGKNITTLSILSSSNADSQATDPASSKLLKNLEEAPLSRGSYGKRSVPVAQYAVLSP
jgi:hypothetical protein